MINKNQRDAERVNVALPVRLASASAVTRDVGAGGICFEVDAPYHADSEISFVIEMDTSGAGLLVKCKGNVVRMQALGQKISVAVKLTEAVMEVPV